MIDDEDNVKLGDFGTSLQFKSDDMLSSLKCLSEGSPYYFAPEIFGNRLISGIKADIWALGVTLYQMNFNKMPFEVERADINMFAALKDKIL